MLIGIDTNIYRDAADRLKTDDALAVAGTADLRGASRIRGAATVDGDVAVGSALAVAGSATFSGTPFIVPHGIIAPGLTQSGEVKTYGVDGAAGRVSYRIGGTIYTLAFPTATHGTVTVTVGTPP